MDLVFLCLPIFYFIIAYARCQSLCFIPNPDHTAPMTYYWSFNPGAIALFLFLVFHHITSESVVPLYSACAVAFNYCVHWTRFPSLRMDTKKYRSVRFHRLNQVANDSLYWLRSYIKGKSIVYTSVWFILLLWWPATLNYLCLLFWW